MNTAIAMMDPIIQSIAIARPGIERGPKLPIPRCVIATVVHQTLELKPRVIPPPNSSLRRRSKSHTIRPTAKERPIKARTACAKPNEVSVVSTGLQLGDPPAATAMPRPVYKMAAVKSSTRSRPAVTVSAATATSNLPVDHAVYQFGNAFHLVKPVVHFFSSAIRCHRSMLRNSCNAFPCLACVNPFDEFLRSNVIVPCVTNSRPRTAAFFGEGVRFSGSLVAAENKITINGTGEGDIAAAPIACE